MVKTQQSPTVQTSLVNIDQQTVKIVDTAILASNRVEVGHISAAVHHRWLVDRAQDYSFDAQVREVIEIIVQACKLISYISTQSLKHILYNLGRTGKQ